MGISITFFTLLEHYGVIPYKKKLLYGFSFQRFSVQQLFLFISLLLLSLLFLSLLFLFLLLLPLLFLFIISFHASDLIHQFCKFLILTGYVTIISALMRQ